MFEIHYSKKGTQLIGRCFFANGKVRYENYSKYYGNEKKDDE